MTEDQGDAQAEKGTHKRKRKIKGTHKQAAAEADAAFGKWLAKIQALGIRAPDANELEPITRSDGRTFFTEMGAMLNGLYGEGYTPEEAARLLKDGRVGVIRPDGTFTKPCPICGFRTSPKNPGFCRD